MTKSRSEMYFTEKRIRLGFVRRLLGLNKKDFAQFVAVNQKTYNGCEIGSCSCDFFGESAALAVESKIFICSRWLLTGKGKPICRRKKINIETVRMAALGIVVSEYRIRLMLSKRDLAKRFGVASAEVSYAENAKRKISKRLEAAYIGAGVDLNRALHEFLEYMEDK